MQTRIEELIERIHGLQEELEEEFRQRRESLGVVLEAQRHRLSREVARQQRYYKVSLLRFLRHSRLMVVLTAPIIYAVFIPFVLIDLFVTIYQTLCFPVYGIPRVRRRDYLVFDRADLPYLNLIERINCAYCSYGNGVAAYVREVSARTEQYWCPIKHARRVRSAHERYAQFFEYGDGEAYRQGLERLRRQYEQEWRDLNAASAAAKDKHNNPGN